MAKIIKKNLINSVAEQYYRLCFYKVLSVIICCALVGLSVAYKQVAFGAVVIVAELVLFLLIGRKASIIKAGAKGEQETLNFLKQLPAKYQIMPDITIHWQSHQAQIDYLIFTPGRVFVLECKNVSGVISGLAQDQTLQQSKIRDGRCYEQKSLYNPLKQVEGHCRVLHQILDTYRFNLEIVPAVFFCNPNAELRVNYGSAHVFSSNQRAQLIRLLLSDQNRSQTYPVKEVIVIITKNKK